MVSKQPWAQTKKDAQAKGEPPTAPKSPRKPKRQVSGWAILLPPAEQVEMVGKDWGKQGGPQIAFCSFLLMDGAVVVFPTWDLAKAYCLMEHQRIQLLYPTKKLTPPVPLCLSNR